MLGKVSTKIKNGGFFVVINHKQKEQFKVGKSLYGLEFKPYNSSTKEVIQDKSKIKNIFYVFGDIYIAETRKSLFIGKIDRSGCFTENHYIIRACSIPQCGQRVYPKKTIKKNCYGLEKKSFNKTEVIKNVRKLTKGIYLAKSEENSKYLVILD